MQPPRAAPPSASSVSWLVFLSSGLGDGQRRSLPVRPKKFESQSDVVGVPARPVYSVRRAGEPSRTRSMIIIIITRSAAVSQAKPAAGTLELLDVCVRPGGAGGLQLVSVGSSATTQDFRSSRGSRLSLTYPIPLRAPMRRRGPQRPVHGSPTALRSTDSRSLKTPNPGGSSCARFPLLLGSYHSPYKAPSKKTSSGPFLMYFVAVPNSSSLPIDQ
ncbi:hypothetical protein VTN02DRAFT_2422 [Thermoascus thermophilus]